MSSSAPSNDLAKPPPPGWTWIDNRVIERAAGVNALAVYLVLANHADTNGECYPSHSGIATTLGISEDTVQRALKSLRDAELISWRRKGRGRGQGAFNIYSLALRNRTDAELKEVTKPQISVTKPQIAPLRNRTGAARTRTKNKNHLEQEPPTPKGDLLELPSDLDNDQFRTVWTEWEQYRREIRKTLTPRTRKRQLAECSEWGVNRAVRAIEKAIKCGWTGFFDPDEKVKRNGKTIRPVGPGQRHPDDVASGEGSF